MKAKMISIFVSSMLAHSINGQVYEKLQIDLKSIFEQSEFCALCDIKIVDSPLKNKYNEFNFYSLVPINVYWGSLKNSELHHEVYSIHINGEKNIQVLVIYNSPKDALPGTWKIKFIALTNGAPDSYYKIDMKDKLSKNDLQEFLKLTAQKKQISHPLDGIKYEEANKSK